MSSFFFFFFLLEEVFANYAYCDVQPCTEVKKKKNDATLITSEQHQLHHLPP